MRLKVFYGSAPTFMESDKKDFDRGRYVCRKLMKNKAGALAVISKSTDPKYPFWKVEHGFSCIMFASCEEAVRYCLKRHFSEA